MTHSQKVLPIFVLGAVGWRAYRRMRKSVGRQRVSPRRFTFMIVLYSLLTAALAAGAILVSASFSILGALAVGTGLGAILGFYGVRLTTFENTPAGRYYRPNPYLGVTVSALFILRLLYRASIFFNAAPTSDPHQGYLKSPLTLFLFGVVAGYYITYFAGVLLHPVETRTSI